MPKPTLFQAVLRMPTRSYANPHAPSPWADYPDESVYEEKYQPQRRYEPNDDEESEEEEEEEVAPRRVRKAKSALSSHTDDQPSTRQNPSMNARDGPDEAGPSQTRKPRSNISAVNNAPRQGRKPRAAESLPSTEQISMGLRFPKPMKRVTTTVVLREGPTVRLTEERDGAILNGQRRKKKVSIQSDPPSAAYPSRPVSPALSSAPIAVSRRKEQQATVEVENAAQPSILQPHEYPSPPIHSASSNPAPTESLSSNAPSLTASPSPTLQQPYAAQRSESIPAMADQRPVPSRVVPPLTPPSSDMSSANSSTGSRESFIRPFTPMIPTIPETVRSVQQPKSSYLTPSAKGGTDDEDDGFHTPRASFVFPNGKTTDKGDIAEGHSLTPRPLAPALAYSSFQVTPPVTAPQMRSTPSIIPLPQDSFAKPQLPQNTLIPSLGPFSLPFSLGSLLTIGPQNPNSVKSVAHNTASRPLAPALGMPSFNLLPPTPAPLPDPETSPFHSESSSSASLSSLHPDRPLPSGSSLGLGTPLAPALSSVNTVIPSPEPSVPRSPANNHEGAESASGELGSDADEESERVGTRSQSRGRHSWQGKPRPASKASKSKDRSRPPSVAKSTASVSVDDRRPLSRQSTTRSVPASSYDDFVVHHRASAQGSEASFGGREGSVRSSPSGYGKGGWAAAAASASGSRNGPVSPVMMYMPSSGNDGWAQFQPPPRQSRFTPLPAASQAMTFEKLLNGGCQNGLAPPGHHHKNGAGTGSSASEYSQSSDDDDLPRPSRSYAKKNIGSDGSQSRSASLDESRPSSPSLLDQAQDYRPALGSDLLDMDGQQVTVTNGVGPGHLSHRPLSSSTARPMSPVSMHSRPTSPSFTDGMPNRPSSRIGFDPPSFLNPDTLTLLPEMSAEDSARTYRPTKSELGRRPSSRASGTPRMGNSMFGGFARSAKSDDGEDERDEVPEMIPRRAQSAVGRQNGGPSVKWEGSSYGEGQLMESHGRDLEVTSGYTNLILPTGAYKPLHPAKSASEINSRILGLPHSTMAAITLSTAASRMSATPVHLRHQLPPPVDFSSHLKPPTKVTNSQILIQVYAVAVDDIDVHALESKGRGDVGKWVPGRSFVGRCLSIGAEEKEIVRGDIVLGLVDVKKSGALSEYILCDRRRLARAPYPTNLSLEQMALLPLHGIAAARAIRTHLDRNSRALIMDAHTGIAALICQAMSKAGVNVTAVIGGGDDHHEAQTLCMNHGAKGVLTGSAAAILLGLDEGGWDFVLDTQGSQRVFDAAKRILKDGGKLASLARPDPSMPSNTRSNNRHSGIKNLRSAFSSRRKDSKYISFEHLTAAGSGEAEVDTSGVDCRDALEEQSIGAFRPVVKNVWPLEKGMEAFRGRVGVSVIRLVN